MRNSAPLAAILLASISIAANPFAAVLADGNRFTTGPVFTEFGNVADVDGAVIPPDATFAVSFDTSEKAADGAVNRTLNSAARFINMHARAGVAPENIQIAVVVHGKAVSDVTKSAGANLDAIAALLDHNVRIMVCGQSAAYRGVAINDLAPGVEMHLSAMTAHALLQQEGYTVNPF